MQRERYKEKTRQDGIHEPKLSPGKRKRPLDWMKKKPSHVPFLSDPSKYKDKEAGRVTE